ncbi:hypothetical protein ACLBXX_00525 [Microbacterium sp. C23T]
MTVENSFGFGSAQRIGFTGEVSERSLGFEGEEIEFPKSYYPRGLSLKSLTVSGNWDGIWGWLRKRHQIYFITAAVDLSGKPPTVMPPAELPQQLIHNVAPGSTISFTLGEGAPLFYPRTIIGGLAVFILVSEADRGIQHVGATMRKVHEDLTANQGAVMSKLTALITNPGKTLADEALGAASAILAPIATVLAETKDDSVGVVQGIFKANSDWGGQLEQAWSGGNVVLGELK